MVQKILHYRVIRLVKMLDLDITDNGLWWVDKKNDYEYSYNISCYKCGLKIDRIDHSECFEKYGIPIIIEDEKETEMIFQQEWFIRR